MTPFKAMGWSHLRSGDLISRYYERLGLPTRKGPSCQDLLIYVCTCMSNQISEVRTRTISSELCIDKSCCYIQSKQDTCILVVACSMPSAFLYKPFFPIIWVSILRHFTFSMRTLRGNGSQLTTVGGVNNKGMGKGSFILNSERRIVRQKGGGSRQTRNHEWCQLLRGTCTITETTFFSQPHLLANGYNLNLLYLVMSNVSSYYHVVNFMLHEIVKQILLQRVGQNKVHSWVVLGLELEVEFLFAPQAINQSCCMPARHRHGLIL